MTTNLTSLFASLRFVVPCIVFVACEKSNLFIGMNSQYTSRGSTLRSQLGNMATMLPTIQMHLMLCTTFASTANKHEFITMAYQLIDRLAALSHLTYPLR